MRLCFKPVIQTQCETQHLQFHLNLKPQHNHPSFTATAPKPQQYRFKYMFCTPDERLVQRNQKDTQIIQRDLAMGVLMCQAFLGLAEGVPVMKELMGERPFVRPLKGGRAKQYTLEIPLGRVQRGLEVDL